MISRREQMGGGDGVSWGEVGVKGSRGSILGAGVEGTPAPESNHGCSAMISIAAKAQDSVAVAVCDLFPAATGPCV